MRNAKMTAVTLSVCFLFIHIFLFLLFFRYNVYPMAWFNVFSMVFYAGSIPFVLKGHLVFYPILVYLVVVLHMSLAIYFTGWSAGFQVPLISMNILLYNSLYLSKRLKNKTPSALPYACIGMFAYLLLCVIDHYHEAEYPLPSNIAFMFQIFWGFTVFVISISSLTLFVNLALKSEKYLEDVADHDQLTGLPNRYYMTDCLNEINDRTGLEGYWLAILDIDDFKVVNDSLGHNCGDNILQQIAKILQDQPEEMTVCRWGGEEFLILVKGSEAGGGKDVIDAMNLLCKRIRERSFLYNNKTLHLTVTIGMSSYRSGMNLREWIEDADNHLYKGKRNGKNKVVA